MSEKIYLYRERKGGRTNVVKYNQLGNLGEGDSGILCIAFAPFPYVRNYFKIV